MRALTPLFPLLRGHYRSLALVVASSFYRC